MSNTTSKKPHGSRGRVTERLFVTKSEIAEHLGVSNMTTIDQWIAAGTWPPAHSRPGERFFVWRRKHWDHYVETGRWPNEAFPKEG